jgi:uncharacterized membrane protein YeaQ/YmgE (transglycosylase-associated protein family)
MDCPVCGLTNPYDSFSKCDCGYDFKTKTGGKKPDSTGWLVDIAIGFLGTVFGAVGFWVGVVLKTPEVFDTLFAIVGWILLVAFLRDRRTRKRLKRK